MVFGLFTKVGNRWRFEGFASNDRQVLDFIRAVKTEIELTKESKVKTTDFHIARLRHDED